MEPTFDTFDADLGSESRVELPSSLQLNKFLYARSKEIEIMRNSLASSGSNTKLAFQKLPKHMRRRAMSHNVKRLPRRLREIHLNQMKKSGLPPKQKRPSRKYRRKASNLLKKYTRRKVKIRWLNTHIWHAKRFHMIERWGYKLPHRLCDKAFTACYRASKNYCLLQDISYFQCVELSGDDYVIINKFRQITSETDGISIGSKAFVNGCREGKILLYKFDSVQKKPIGIVEFLWQCIKNEQGHTALWLWIHAAFYDEVLQTLLKCFDLVKNKDIYLNNDKSVHLKELRTELNRFRLSGNLSNTVLHNCLKTYNSKRSLSEWFKDFYKLAQETVDYQNKYWNDLKSITSVNMLPPHIVLPIIVHDPRLNSPKMRTMSQAVFSSESLNMNTLSFESSPLWHEKVRETINSTKPSNTEIAEVRKTILVSGTDLIDLASPVPIILVQRPGNRLDNLGYSSGWDIILPSSWAQPIWISLIMWGARSGGLREFEHNIFEMGKPNFLYPDTTAGEKEELCISKESLETYFRKPPNKRINFNKFKIVSPFKFNWKLLIQNWISSEVDNFTVLRDRKLLMNLQKCIELGKGNISLPDNCLIPVQVHCDKGIPEKFAVICIPLVEDLKKVPVEIKCGDPNQKERKTLRTQHKKMLKRLKQKRKRAQDLGTQLQNIRTKVLLEYSTRMKKLWIPDVEDIKNSCSREILGFVREGSFSMTLGHGKGIGYIVGAAVNTLVNIRSKDKVLIRNTNSIQYYIAKLSVITEL